MGVITLESNAGIVGSAAAEAVGTAIPYQSNAGRKGAIGGDMQYCPWGTDDQLPDHLIALAERSSVLPGIFEFWEGVLFGDGLGLYQRRWDAKKKQVVVEQVYDPESFAWLNDTNALYTVLDVLPDFLYTGNGFVQGILNKGSSTVKKRINEFMHTDCVDCRLGVRQRGKIPYSLVGQFSHGLFEYMETTTATEKVMMFDRATAEQHKKVMFHIARKKPGRKYYPLPIWYSPETVKMLDMTFEVFSLQTAELKNAMKPRFMIKVWKDYFAEKYPEPEFTEADRQKKKEELVQSVHDNLTKPENAGKNLWCDFVFDEQSGQVKASVIVESIEYKGNDAAYGKQLDQHVALLAMATNTNPGLADLIIQGKMGGDTGSAVRESYNVLAKTKAKVNRLRLLRFLNDAYHFSFDGKSEFYWDFQSFALTTTDQQKSGVQEEAPQRTEEREDLDDLDDDQLNPEEDAD